LEVEDFDGALAAVQEQKIPIAMGPHEFPSCRMVVLTDQDGNRITLHKKK
jgi:predicted enzyme related to lactoylglutathione lyase